MKKYIAIITLLAVSVCYAATRNIVPRADNEGGIGTSAKNWANGYFTALDSDTIITNLLDTTGAADMDYGSVDVLDHTFTTDDCTVIIDGGITVSTGDTITLGAIVWNSGDNIDGEVIADDTIDDDSIDFADVTGADLTLTDCGAITSTGAVLLNNNLSVGNAATSAGVLTLLEDDDDGANFASFQVPALTANTVYTLPPDDGDAGEQLQTNGAGVLTWEAAGGAGATAYDDIGDPDAAGSISFDDTETATYVTATTATDFFHVNATGIFGDISIFKVTQDTGNPTNGTLIESSTADAEDDVDQLLLGNGADDYVTFHIVEAGTFTIDVTSDGAAAVAIPDPITANGGITSSGTIEAATLTEGGVGVPNLNETDWVDFAEIVNTATLAGNPALAANEVWFGTTGLIAEGSTADTIETLVTFADPTVADKTITFPNATGTVVLKDSTDTLTNKTLAAADNVIEADTGDSATAFFAAGTIEHERGGLQADISAYTGLIAITGADTTAEVDAKSELEAQIADVSDFAEADGDVYTNNHDFGGADLEIPQASPAAPDADGEIEIDFTDGSLVVQHGSAHAVLGGATDVVVGKLIKSFSATLAMPDGLQAEIDQWPLKAIESTEFPHGIVITAIRLKTSASSTYAINVENWDDPTTINGVNPTIDAITTSASTEAVETTITYATIAAGQIIMLDLPATDIGWVTIQIEYYEPIS